MKKIDQIQRFIYKVYDYRISIMYQKKIKLRLSNKNLPKLNSNEKKKISKLFLSYNIKNIKTDWHEYYSALNKTFSEKYVPEDFFYSKLEPLLNDRSKVSVIADKNLLSKLFPNIEQPKTIVKNINGIYLSNDDRVISFKSAIETISKHSAFIIKPSIDSGGGKNVVLFSQESDGQPEKEEIDKVLIKFKQDFIVQEVLTQHANLKKLNPSSINSIRVMSFLNDKTVKVLSSFVRMGKKDSFADNVSKGGLCCGIDEGGKLSKMAWNLHFDQFSDNGNEIEFDSIKIPYYQEIVQKVRELHQMIPYFRIVSWDISVDSFNNIVLIELNPFKQGINSHQVINGPILFECLDFAYKTN